MPTKKYLVETDKGKFMVEVDEPANMQAVGGDTINGHDPNAPSMMGNVQEALGHAAQPESVGDFLSLLVPAGTGEAITGLKDMGRILSQAVKESPSLKGALPKLVQILRERPTSLEEFKTRGFNQLPLHEQMKHLPETPAPPERPMPSPLPRVTAPVETPTPAPVAPTPQSQVSPVPVQATPAQAEPATPVSPTQTAAKTGTRVRRPTSGEQALAELNLTDGEIRDAVKWHDQGVPPKVIIQRIVDSRKLVQVTGGATPDEAIAKVQSALHTGKF